MDISRITLGSILAQLEIKIAFLFTLLYQWSVFLGRTSILENLKESLEDEVCSAKVLTLLVGKFHCFLR